MGMIGSIIKWLFVVTPPEEPEQEQEAVDMTVHPEADAIAKEMAAARHAILYGRVRGDLERIVHLQKELDNVDNMIIHTRSHYIRQNAGMEKQITISTPWNGDEGDKYVFDIAHDEQSRDAVLKLLEGRQATIRDKLISELVALSKVILNQDSATRTTDAKRLARGVSATLNHIEKNANQ